MSDFPADFIWGSGTAAHQVEGGNVNNDWWRWEHTEGSPCVEPSGDAIDQWHRFDSDFGLLASLGQNAHRFSIEWSRVEPAEGEFSRASLDHYKRVLDSLAQHELTAFATMYHFTLPTWFADRGGWLAQDSLDLFGRFVERVAATLGDRIPYACTINEPQIQAMIAHYVGHFPPGHHDLAEAMRVNQTLIQAHRVATAALRNGLGAPRVGTCLSLPVIEPVDPSNAEEVALADSLRTLLVDSHIDDLQQGGDVGDFVGLQYYTRMRVETGKAQLTAPPPVGTETTLMGWEIYPAGLGQVLRRIADAGLPVIITENGIATHDDAQRVRYLRSHLAEVRSAMADGVDIRGYIHWSSFDNFEWAHGYAPTFGLIGIDREDDLRRFVRPSAELYGEVCRTGSLKPLEDSGY